MLGMRYTIVQDETQLHNDDPELARKAEVILSTVIKSKALGGVSLMIQWLRIRKGRWLDPWSGKIPRAMEQLNWSTTATQPVARARELQRQSPRAREPVLHHKRSHRSTTSEWTPLSATREGPRAVAKTHHSQNKK